jgi:hypothetical protein
MAAVLIGPTKTKTNTKTKSNVIVVIYFKHVPVSDESVVWNDYIIVRNEQGKMWKEAVVV